MTREEVLRYDVWTDIYDDTRAEESPDGEWVRYKDHAKALDDTKMEIDRLREERDAIAKRFTGACDMSRQYAQTYGIDRAGDNVFQTMRDDAERQRRILAALREPSLEIRDAVIGVLNNRSVTDTRLGEDIDEIIEAAVAAAEKEVGA